ncbi:excalibur calcium-binding domain-containing protein [Flavobacterium poyangense]|uniref:excalibur calcium-binding domain-containing protein n=1 Tax=Flavobacterium poyangense TaxID=2204302 RepID=UPI001422F5CC|nr:excalibur calcium-binding domain-containing protein [Flavobacterium sp. JXAS1]
MGYRKGYFKKDGTYVQGHFANKRSKTFSNKNNGCLLFFVALLLLGLPIACSDSSSSETTGKKAQNDCPTKTCGDFTAQAQAQAAFNSNKSCYKNLDSDGDGIACENLSK